MYATIEFTSYADLPDLISVSARIDPHSQMDHIDTKGTYRMNWFDFARTPCLVLEPEPLNTFERINTVLAVTFEEEPLEEYFWEQSDVPFPWNMYWTDASRESRGLDINDPVFG